MALVQLQVRSDTAAAWTAANPVLLAGEPGFETDTGKLKLGDGVRNWATLPYTSGVSLSSAAPPVTGSAAAGTSGQAARADHSHALPASLSCATLAATGEVSVGGNLTVTGELRGGPHKHATNDITGLTAFVVSTINNTLKAGSNVALSFDSVTNALTVSSTAASTGGGSGAGVTSINGQTGAVTLAILSASDVVSQIATALQTIDGITETYDSKAGTITLSLSTVSGGTYGGTPTTTPLAFLAIPQAASAVSGNASFSATATGGTASIAYQWEVSTDSGASWSSVAGGTSASLSLTGLTATEHGRQYRVRATSGTETIYSPSATLSTVTLEITAQPSDAAITVGQSFSLSVTASAPGAITYQWQYSDDAGASWWAVSGATSSTYSSTQSSVLAGRLFRAAVSSGGATVFSRAALVTAVDPPLTISLQPVDTIAASCAASLSFDWTYAGSASVAMQWQRRANATSAWVNVAGATGKVLSLTGLVATDSGAQYRAGATIGTRTVYTNVATLTVPALEITDHPADATAFDGQAVFAVDHSGACGSVAIRWEVRQPTGTTWAIVPGQTSATLALTGLTRANSGQVYRAVVRVGTQTVTSNEATLTVESISGFTTMPASTSVASGEEVTFSFVWSNSTDRIRSWWEVSRDNGVTWENRLCSEFGDCNAPTLVFRPLPSDNGSQYRVAVLVAATGFVYRSEPATLTVAGASSVTSLGISTPPLSIAGDGAGGLVVTVAPLPSRGSSVPGGTSSWSPPQRTALCYVSTNSGATFSPVSLPVAGVWTDAACGGSTWVAIDPVTGTIAYSTNRGRQWQAATVDVPFGGGDSGSTTSGTVAPAYIDHLPGAPIPFVASTTAGVYTSPNGIAWTRRSTLATTGRPVLTELTPVTYGSGKYVVVTTSGIWTSTNGTGWANSVPATTNTSLRIVGGTTTHAASAVRFAGGWFAGVSGGWYPASTTSPNTTVRFAISGDALSWSPVAYNTTSDYYNWPISPPPLPAAIGDGVFQIVATGAGSSQAATVAALYPAEDADSWVIAAGGAAIQRPASGWWRPGKAVAYVSPGRVAIAGMTNPAAGTGSQSAAVAVLDARTPFSGTVPNASAPTAPQTFRAESRSTAIRVSWSEPLSNGGMPITSYTLQIKVAAQTTWSTVTLATPLSTSHTISGLTNGVAYDVRVAAVSGAGTGVYATAQATPALTAPGAPTGLTATPIGPPMPYGSWANSRYSLSWTAPSNNGGSSITEYVVQAQYVGPSAWPGGWVTLPYNLFTITLSGTTATVSLSPRLNSLAKMAFRVAARNSVGTGEYSVATPLVSLN